MADMDSLIVTFQTQLTDVMESVVKTAMYEVTKLVEDGLLLELKARAREVERLRLQLQRTERQMCACDQQGATERTVERENVIKDEEEKQQERHTEVTSCDVSNSKHANTSGSTASFSPVWTAQSECEEPLKQIDNIKEEVVEPITCSSVNLEDMRVTLSEVQAANTSVKIEVQDSNNELLKHIVQQTFDPQISAKYVVSFAQPDNNNDTTHTETLNKNSNWAKIISTSENISEAQNLLKTTNKVENNSNVTLETPRPSCHGFGVAIKQEANAESETVQTVNKALSSSVARTGTSKPNRFIHKSFIQVVKSKGSSSFRSNLLQRPMKKLPITINSSTPSVGATHSQGISTAPPPLSLSVQRANLGDRHGLNRSGSSYINIKQSSNSSQTSPSLNLTSNVDGTRPIFRCGQCGKCFPHPSNLKSHLLSHSGERPFCCSLCGRTFTKLSNLKAHRRVHTGERPYSCVSCGKRFTQNCNLKRHQRIHLEGPQQV